MLSRPLLTWWPQFIRPISIGTLFFLSAALAILMTRFDNGVAFIWIANAILIGELIVAPPRRRVPTIIACAAGSWLASACFSLGPIAAFPIVVINICEAVISSELLRRLTPRDGPLDTLSSMTAFVLSVGLISPALGAPFGALVAVATGHGTFVANIVHWYAGHALGALAFTPIAMLLLRGDAKEWIAAANYRNTVHVVIVLGMMVVTSVGVFYQTSLPLLFLPMLPLIIATFRLGGAGAAASIIILAVSGSAFTVLGHGPIGLIHGSHGLRIEFLQFYLAVNVLTALPVAADLARRKHLFGELRDSEARYRLVADHSSDIVMNIDLAGIVQYVSPSVILLAGYQPDQILGRSAFDVVHPDDLSRVVAGHADAMSRPNEMHTIEYRGRLANGEWRWCEGHTRGVFDDDGRATGVVTALRDISHRKEIEAQLTREAGTDALTGVANRRSFTRLIDDAFALGQPACLAVLDIDFFKRVNDLHGHPAGDAVLQRFAQIALQAVRGSDVVARIGGEEFAILLRGAGIEEASAVCERLRQAVAAAIINGPTSRIRITVSAGIIALDQASDPAALFIAADAALYRAKADGRNRLVLAA